MIYLVYFMCKKINQCIDNRPLPEVITVIFISNTAAILLQLDWHWNKVFGLGNFF